MRLTYSQILAQHLRNINLSGSQDAGIIADFTQNLGTRYQLMLAKLENYRTNLEYGFNVGMTSTLGSTGIAQQIATVTSSGTTATIVTSAAHGYSSTNVVTIGGINPSGFNGTYTITVVNSTTFTYTLGATLNGVAGTTSQFYPLPVGEVTIEGMYITVNGVNFPLQIINSRYNWEQLNAIQIQASAIPQFYFPRRDDFGIWPTPQAMYTGNMSYYYRDRNLSIADYTGTTMNVVNGSTLITGFGSAFTPAMVGRWFTVTDPTAPGQGYWYRITGYVDTNNLTLYQPYSGVTKFITGFLIGQTPELPEEGHGLLNWGVLSDYYAGIQKDPTNAALYNNYFWTGDFQNSTRVEGSREIAGGLLGMMSRYNNRDNSRVVRRKPKLNPLQYKVFATTLS